ncbi:class I SAM-dependent methyltransferase [Natronorubrum tibetense]|uniref:class I SAM-dependent methyltransferase n=1 Tax=Natronorubrum tibetense TaxID=63128 RepID=UPI0009DAF4B4|nr:class I SAM-dependent methyltransferase [Natronorubrum tibetense]
MPKGDNWSALAKKGLKKPHRIPPFVLRQMFPKKFQKWKSQEGVVTWDSFSWGDGSNPAQISAINYHMVQALRKDLEGHNFETAVEIGCGYGRVTPWLSDYASTVIGIEPNEEMAQYIEKYHPNIKYIQSKAQDMPLDDDSVGLIFTRSVLQHIPPNDIQSVCNEVSRVTSSNSRLLLCEATSGEGDNQSFWPRPKSTYKELFSDFELTQSWKRDAPAKTREHTRERMTFICKQS